MRATLAPCRFRFRCAVWACVLGFGFRLRPASPWGVVGVCVCSCTRPAWSPAPPGWGCCAEVRVCARAPLVPCLSWRGCGLWACVPGLGLGCSPPLLVGLSGCVLVPDAAWPGSDQRPWGTAPAAGPVGWLGLPSAPDPWNVGSFLSLGRPTCARVCGVLGHLAPVHRCARLVRCFPCAVSWATWLLFTGLPARCVALRVRCPWPLGSCSPVCPLDVLPVCAVSWATWLLFSGVPAWCIVLPVRCPGPLGSCSPMCQLGALFCLCGGLGHLASVHRCARLVPCFACAVSWATWLLFTGVQARRVALRVRCPGPLGSCSPVCPLGVLCCVCGVLDHLAPVHRFARSVRCFACAVFWATWLLFTAVPARCAVLRVRCPGPLGPFSLVCPLVALPVCAVSWATWLLFIGVPAPHVVLRVRCPGPLDSCSPVCPLSVVCCVCCVLGPWAPVHWCARPVCCAVSWAIRLLFTSVLARCVVLRIACAGRRCRVLTRHSGRWLFVAGRGWVPSGCALVHSDGGCS